MSPDPPSKARCSLALQYPTLRLLKLVGLEQEFVAVDGFVGVQDEGHVAETNCASRSGAGAGAGAVAVAVAVAYGYE